MKAKNNAYPIALKNAKKSPYTLLTPFESLPFIKITKPKTAIATPIKKLFLMRSLKNKTPKGMSIKHDIHEIRLTFATLVLRNARLKNTRSKAKKIPAKSIKMKSFSGTFRVVLLDILELLESIFALDSIVRKFFIESFFTESFFIKIKLAKKKNGVAMPTR